MKRGSITPFLALSLMLIASLLLVLLESARVHGLDRYATLKAEAGVDCVCAEYQPLLWQQYGLLLLDGAYGAEHFSMDFVTETLKEQITLGMKVEAGLNFLTFAEVEPELTGYALATDDKGEIFLNYVAEREKENLPVGVAENICEQYKKGKEVEDAHADAEESIMKAKEITWEVISMEQDVEEEEDYIDTSGFSNTWNHVTSVQNSTTLNLICGSSQDISTKESFMKNGLQEREKLEGNMNLTMEKEWYRKLLVLHYMEQYFSNYLQQKPEHYLSYEMEYVLCGKATEWQNLDATLDKLIWMRVAYNMVSLTQDEEKMNGINALANVLGLLAKGNTAVVNIFKTGLTAAWAYMESILDVRALVAGEKISLIKTKEEWTSDASHLSQMFSRDARAKSSEKGFGYVDYVKQLLFFTKDSDVAYRMMEAMEFSMENTTDYKNCKMHHMIVAMQYQIEFVTKPLFSSLVSIGNAYDGEFYFKKKVSRSYIP